MDLQELTHMDDRPKCKSKNYNILRRKQEQLLMTLDQAKKNGQKVRIDISKEDTQRTRKHIKGV